MASKRFAWVLSLALLTTAGASWAKPSSPPACESLYERLHERLQAETGRKQLSARIIRAPDPRLSGATLTTTSDILKALGSGKVYPPVDEDGIRMLFFNSCSPLGYGLFAQLGPFGPLSKWGPNGSRWWNPSRAISSCNWTKLSAALRRLGGPMSSMGSLSQLGATGEYPYKVILPLLGPYGKQMQEGGILAIFGPKGPLGPHGPLGLLSGVGGTGLKADPLTGEFKNGRRVVHEIQNFDGKTVKSYRLEETYSAKKVEELSKKRELDASFIVDEKTKAGEIHDFNVNVRGGTWAHFVVSPEGQFDRFSIELLAENGTVIARSDSADLVNSISIRVPSDARVKVRIQYEGSTSLDPFASAPMDRRNPGYRLIATEAQAETESFGFDGMYLTHLE